MTFDPAGRGAELIASDHFDACASGRCPHSGASYCTKFDCTSLWSSYPLLQHALCQRGAPHGVQLARCSGRSVEVCGADRLARHIECVADLRWSDRRTTRIRSPNDAPARRRYHREGVALRQRRRHLGKEISRSVSAKPAPADRALARRARPRPGRRAHRGQRRLERESGAHSLRIRAHLDVSGALRAGARFRAGNADLDPSPVRLSPALERPGVPNPFEPRSGAGPCVSAIASGRLRQGDCVSAIASARLRE